MQMHFQKRAYPWMQVFGKYKFKKMGIFKIMVILPSVVNGIRWYYVIVLNVFILFGYYDVL
jgi:hypothetical protein